MKSIVGCAATLGLLVACGDDSGSGGSGGSGASSSDGGGGAAVEGGAPPEGGAGEGGAGECLDFGSDCDEAADTCCDAAGETGLCFAFGMGSKCTIPCPTDPADCPNDGAGCNNMTPSYCKAN